MVWPKTTCPITTTALPTSSHIPAYLKRLNAHIVSYQAGSRDTVTLTLRKHNRTHDGAPDQTASR